MLVAQRLMPAFVKAFGVFKLVFKVISQYVSC